MRSIPEKCGIRNRNGESSTSDKLLADFKVVEYVVSEHSQYNKVQARKKMENLRSNVGARIRTSCEPCNGKEKYLQTPRDSTLCWL